ncbi:PfkB family carbohydrate kinase [Cellulomonas wangsupingiae]|uniref:PfkB family carbohydrate kinase n=1 Tax=Cellulomonas wangsupingiae TaxID=2968085 RepID=A0ABY5KBN3_9CELL|nr:PfkB family carbohydrate kinase [Cellulomonas wangsupingiae]MCC2334658.1 PfkB family carbohydrate kinase [Cellulomonas wangsupingiae]MCM0638622.1 PfkB family carbohydrate kinase [Cellulomonas wangsupingiae]UUI66381.1 PfkB family carbohydrate kinase [Cellulomonas wangsupingiae]
MRDRLVCCGLTTLDVTQVLDRLPAPDEKVVADGLDVTFGGPAANAAAVAAGLGVPTTLVTALGTGALADVARAGLAAAGVDVVDLAPDAAGVLPVSTVLVTRATGERAVVSVNGTGAPHLARPDVALLRGAGALLVDGHHPAAGLALAAAARAAGVPVLLDGGSWKPSTAELLAAVDLAVLSADFAVPGWPQEPAPGAEDPVDGLLDAVAAFGPGFVARSAGPGPVRVRRAAGEGGPARTSLRPAAVPAGGVVDTLGAGDVLHGAMAAALARGADPLDALAEGMRCATESVQHAGARGWLAGGAVATS